jgi:hypothetical protein
MRVCLAAALLIQTGCAAAVRVTIGPTVDTFGNVGAELKVTAGLGLRTVMLQPSLGGSYLARERTGALTVSPELTYWLEPVLIDSKRRMPALRAAFFFSGHLGVRIARALNRVTEAQRARGRRSLSRAHLADTVGGEARAQLSADERAASLRARRCGSVYVGARGRGAAHLAAVALLVTDCQRADASNELLQKAI